MLRTLLIACCVATGLARIVTFKDCGSVGGKIHSVDVNPCPAEPCEMHKGTNVSIQIIFDALVNSPSARNDVHAIILGKQLPFPVPASWNDCCANNNLKCPIVASSSDVYNNVVFVHDVYPAVALVAKWEVKAASGQDIMCFLIPLKIVG